METDVSSIDVNEQIMRIINCQNKISIILQRSYRRILNSYGKFKTHNTKAKLIKKDTIFMVIF